MSMWRKFVAALIAACIAWAPVQSAAVLKGSAGVGPPGAVSITGGTITGTNAPYVLSQAAIPFIHISSGSIGNNGALTGVTALPTTYSNGAYVYYPTNSISASTPAGWYWTVFSSTTAGTIYNSTWSGTGTPTAGTLTAFATTGPGAFTGDTTERVAVTIALPAGAMGANGVLDLYSNWATNATAGTKTARLRWDGASGTAFLSNAFSTDVWVEMRTVIRNSASATVNKGGSVGVSSGVGARATSPSYTAINSAVATTIVLSLVKATATDNAILEGYDFRVMYAP